MGNGFWERIKIKHKKAKARTTKFYSERLAVAFVHDNIVNGFLIIICSLFYGYVITNIRERFKVFIP